MTSPKLLSFSPSGEKLAHSGASGILRIWDTISGLLDHEFQPAEHLTATISCIRFSPVKLRKKTEKRSNTDDDENSLSCLLAMGTLAGTILIFCPERREVINTMEHAPPHAILDIAWHPPRKSRANRFFTLAANNTIMDWNLVDRACLRTVTVNGGHTFSALAQGKICLANRSIEIVTINKKSSDAQVKNTFTGHTSIVTQLIPLPCDDGPVRYFISTSQDDRFVYAWDLMGNNEDPAVSFMVEDVVGTVSVSELKNSTVSLSATTRTGALVLFTLHLNGNKHRKPVKSTGKLQIVTDSGGKQTIPIISSFFCNDIASSIVIVYGSTTVFRFERISVADITKDKKLIRTEPSASTLEKRTSMVKTVTPKITKDTTMKGPGHIDEPTESELKRKRGDENGVASLPMEERLNALVLDKTTHDGTQPPTADNLVHLLLQGLHSKDQRILLDIFDRDDEETIKNTVRRLPAIAVVPLLKQLQTQILGRGRKNCAIVTWVRSVLYYHMTHLSTLPDREELMRPFYSSCVARMTTLHQVTQLHARLDLMLTHVATRHQEDKQAAVEPEAILVYRAESSDEDDMMEAPLGVSESEDNWDELSDFGEINGHTDEESDMEVDQHISSVKRRLEEEEDDVESAEESDDSDLIVGDDGDETVSD